MASESSQQEAVILKILEDSFILFGRRFVSILCDEKVVPVQHNRIDDDGFKRGKSKKFLLMMFCSMSRSLSAFFV